MVGIDWSKFDSKFWKPETGVEYVVRARGWRVEERSFSGMPPQSKLVMDILEVANPVTGTGGAWNPPKEFTIGNMSFIKGIRPIIEAAEASGQEEIFFQMKKLSDDKKTPYAVFTWTPPKTVQHFFGMGVKEVKA